MEKRYELNILGITYNQIESGVYAVILQEKGGTRRIPIIIGVSEAQAIECKLQQIVTPRPLTHDLMVNIMKQYDIRIVEIELKKLPNGVFAADLHLTDGIRRFVVDSRSSDAIALAVRVGAPIYTSEKVLEEAGFDSRDKGAAKQESDSTKETPRVASDLRHMSEAEIREAMEKASLAENYEEAARLKQELDRLKQSKSAEDNMQDPV